MAFGVRPARYLGISALAEEWEGNMRIGICGAGVGGLSTAAGLLSLGYEVDVFEKAPDIRTTGAGFNLWPNAGRAINGLGLGEQYREISVQLDRYIELDTEGKELFSTDTSHWPEKYGAPAVGLYRPELALSLIHISEPTRPY